MRLRTPPLFGVERERVTGGLTGVAGSLKLVAAGGTSMELAVCLRGRG